MTYNNRQKTVPRRIAYFVSYYIGYVTGFVFGTTRRMKGTRNQS